jgi:fumarate reductase flavoprotein subunit
MTVAAEKMQADMVIVGAGGAGLTAAVSALESGAENIVILEKAASIGGTTNVCAGMFAVNSPAQKRKGIHVSIEEAFNEKMDAGNWRIDPDLTRVFIEKSGEIVEWFESRGMTFDNVIEFVREGDGPKVFHTFCLGPDGFIGKKIADTLAGECRGAGVHIMCETAARNLLTDEAGRISGLIAETEGRFIRIDTPVVILAAGGFGENRELMNRYFPGNADTFTKEPPEVTGDALIMAEALNAVIDDNMSILFTGPHHYPESHILTMLVHRPDILIVNKNGKRYSKETIFLDYHTEAGNLLDRQPDHICYALLDNRIKTDMIRGKEVISGFEKEAGGNGEWLDALDPELERCIAGGTAFKADSLEGLAEQLGIPADVLRNTVGRYNAFCDAGCDEDYYKEKKFLLPIRQAPFYAVLGKQGFDCTVGGIKINYKTEVMSRQDRPIRGLYAAGDCASGWEYRNYNLKHPGSAMTFAFVSGFFAGQNAAAYVAEKE